MATAPKFTYRNAVTIPRQPNVSIYVDVPPLINDRFLDDSRTLSEDYILRCFGHAMYLSGVPYDVNRWNNYMMFSNYEEALGTFVYEDMTLREMKSPENPSYKKLEANLKWIGDTLGCNVSVFVGHVNTCRDYIDSIYKKAIEELTMLSSLPTIYLIIACHGDTMAHVLNTDSKYDIFRQHKITFFGFEDLLHIHEGEIYSTKLFDTARSKAICDSEEMVSLFDSFSADLEAEGIKAELPIEPQEVLELYRRNPSLKIFNCCRTKLGRLYSDFVKGLERRKTTRYTKEILKKKFEPFIKKAEKLTRDSTTITSDIGIDCDKTNCHIPNLYEVQELEAQEYNKKGSFHTLFRELKNLINPGYIYENGSYESQEEFHKGVEQFYRKIQDLKGKDMSVFTYTPILDTISPILFQLIQTSQIFEAPNYSLFKIFRFILQKYGAHLDFTLKMPSNGMTILHVILLSNFFHQKEELILFKTIYEYLPNESERESLFFHKDTIGNIPLASQPHFRPLICLFYIEKFGAKLKDVQFISKGREGNLLHLALLQIIPEVLTEESSLVLDTVKGLLNVGVNPNQKLIEEKRVYNGFLVKNTKVFTVKPLELHTQLYLPLYNPILFQLFLQYGMTNDTFFFTKQKEFYENLLQNPLALESFKKAMNAVEDYIHEFGMNLRQFGGMPRYNYNNYSPPNSPYSYNDRYNIESRITYRLSTGEYAIYSKKIELLNSFIFAMNGSQIQKNIDIFLNTTIPVLRKTITLFAESLKSRKGVKKHGSKVRKTYKTNKLLLNKTIKNTFNTIVWNVNGEKMIGDYVGKILELAKRQEFTKEEKALYKKKPIEIQKSNLQPKDKYLELKKYYEQMESVLKTR